MTQPPASPPPPGQPPPSAAWTAPAYQAPPSTKTSGLAIASLVTGILFCFVVTPVVAVVTGHLALDNIRDADGTISGRGMAIAGVTLGWIFLGLVAIALLAWVVSLVAA
jgi:hypothetical protein